MCNHLLTFTVTAWPVHDMAGNRGISARTLNSDFTKNISFKRQTPTTSYHAQHKAPRCVEPNLGHLEILFREFLRNVYFADATTSARQSCRHAKTRYLLRTVFIGAARRATVVIFQRGLRHTSGCFLLRRSIFLGARRRSGDLLLCVAFLFIGVGHSCEASKSQCFAWTSIESSKSVWKLRDLRMRSIPYPAVLMRVHRLWQKPR